MSRHNDTSFLSFVFQNNIFYYDKPAIQYGYWYCQGQPTCTNYFQFDNNLYFNKAVLGGQPAQPFFKTPYTLPNTMEQPTPTWMSFAQWQAQGEDMHSRFADPLFVNPAPAWTTTPWLRTRPPLPSVSSPSIPARRDACPAPPCLLPPTLPDIRRWWSSATFP
jgi:hypothetical protein